MPNFTTGSTLLPDVGQLSYSGCVFSPLFETRLSARTMKDEANRVVKYNEIVLTADGYVTMGDQALFAGIAPTMANLHKLLTTPAGILTYQGRGFDLVVNRGNARLLVAPTVGQNMDVAWGPIPEVLEFQPLGGGLSAKISWRVTVRVSPTPIGKGFAGVGGATPFLQFNYETTVIYNEDGYSSLSVSGTLEIPMTRPNQVSKKVFTTADDYRAVIKRRILDGIDLSRFSITRRDFPLSRDKRTLTWNVTAEEKPFMDLPPNCTVARGTYDVNPAKTGPGLALWICSLRVTYTLRKDIGRRQAYELFLALLRLRMAESSKGNIPKLKDKDQGGIKIPSPTLGLGGLGLLLSSIGMFKSKPVKEVEDVRKAILIDFRISEGLYLDSKNCTFFATWRMCTTLSHIIVASGLWRKLAEVDDKGNNLWATSMQDVMGEKSWLANRTDPNLDIIVDFGFTE